LGWIGAKVVGEPIRLPVEIRGSRTVLRGDEFTSRLWIRGEAFATAMNTGVDREIMVGVPLPN